MNRQWCLALALGAGFGLVATGALAQQNTDTLDAVAQDAQQRATADGATAAVRRVMVFGDSNSWGWIPIEEGAPTTRYDADARWPGVLQATLGDGYEVIEEALSGRTTNADDPPASGRDGSLGGAGLNGAAYLPASLASHLPLDLVVVMLGTNDTKAYFDRSTVEIALGALELADITRSIDGGIGTDYPAPEVLLIAPPPLPGASEYFGGVFDAASAEKSAQLDDVLGPMAQAIGVGFYAAGGAVPALDGVDGVHMSPEAHRALGEAVAQEVQKIVPAQ